MIAFWGLGSPFESRYKALHGRLFYGSGYELPLLGRLKCREHHDERRFVLAFLATSAAASLLPFVCAKILATGKGAVAAVAALPFFEWLRFTLKWSYAAFGFGPAPWAVKALAPAEKAADSVRFVVISDTHNRHGELRLPSGDVLLHCGDFTERGTAQEISDFNDWLGTAASHFKRRLVIAGNHDLGLDPDLDDLPWKELVQPKASCKKRSAAALKALLTNCEYLQGEEAEPERGIRIYGAPWCPAIAVPGVFQVPGAFNRNPESRKAEFLPTPCTWINADHKPFVPISMTNAVPSIEACWDFIPEGINVLVTHGPPLGILDEDFGAHYGDPTLNKAVQRVKPQFHIFGHVHPGYGVSASASTTFINGASVTNLHDAKHAPIVFDVACRA